MDQQQAEILLMLFRAQYSDWSLEQVVKKFFPKEKHLIGMCSDHIKISDCSLTSEYEKWLGDFFVCLEDNEYYDIVEIRTDSIKVYERSISMGEFLSSISFEDKI